MLRRRMQRCICCDDDNLVPWKSGLRTCKRILMDARLGRDAEKEAQTHPWVYRFKPVARMLDYFSVLYAEDQCHPASISSGGGDSAVGMGVAAVGVSRLGMLAKGHQTRAENCEHPEGSSTPSRTEYT